MTFRRLAAIGLIFVGASAAWTVLGSSLLARTGQFDGRLEREVQLLWGGPHRQIAPDAWVERPDIITETVERKDDSGRPVRTQVTRPTLRSVPVDLESTRAAVNMQLEHRRKGLLWYPTYTVAFAGTYTFRNPDAQPRVLRIRFRLPAPDALFDDFVFAIDGRPAGAVADASRELTGSTEAAPGVPVTLTVQYRSRGLRSWVYAFAKEGVAQVRDFRLGMRTNFEDVDYPAGSVSPGESARIPGGRALVWTFANLISGQTIGMELPNRLNPGPFAARVTFFAPVSLLFFLAVMVIVGLTRGPSLHPMHYWFIAAAFFAFHLLLAYLVDHVSVHAAFAAAAAASLALVVSYLRVVTGMRHALAVAGTAQLVFLVLFSYAFFFEGVTGLAITIVAILTLFVLMQMTARVSWDDVFAGGDRTDARSAARRNADAAHG